MKVINDLLGYRDLKIVQDNDMFSFSLDSILLANFVSLNKNINSILDIGCGNAPIPIILSTRSDAKITGVEIQKDVYNLALESVKINNLDINIINDDINDFYVNTESDSFDVITCNPPFFKINEGSKFNDSEYKMIARHEVKLNLKDIVKVSRKLLKNNGVLALVHRPDRLIDIICLMREYNIEPKKIRFVYPYIGSESNMVLIEGRKNGKAGLKVFDPLYCHKSNGEYTDEVLKYFEG